MKNREIREELQRAHVFHYQLADMLGVNETTLCRRLRKELTPSEKQRYISLIHEATKKEASDD